MADSTTSAAKKRSGAPPILCILLGLLALLLWVTVTIIQIQTSEAFLLHGGAVTTIAANWSILMQPVDLVQGHLSIDMAKATIWGWGIEIVFLICVIGYEIAHESLKASSQRLGNIFATGSFALILLNGWTDFQYGQMASGFWGQLAFAAITTFIVAVFGVIGWRLIEHGLKGWSE